MTIRVELRCDVGFDGPVGFSAEQPFCYSKRPNIDDADDHPHAVTTNEKMALAKAKTFVEEDARRRGWVHSVRGWVCPNCKTIMALPPIERVRISAGK